MPASNAFTLSATNGPLLADIEEAMRELGGYYDITLDDLRTIYQHAFTAARQRLFRSLTAETLMTTPALALRQDASVREAAAFLDCHGISGAPVVDGEGRMAGMLSEKDLRHFIGNAFGITLNSALSFLCHPIPDSCLSLLLEQQIQAIMKSPVLSVKPQTSLGAIMNLFHAHHINRVPVRDADGMLRGMVSRSDIINSLRPLS